MLPPIIRTLFRNVPTVAPVSHRSVLSVTGSQASEFLNGLLSSSVHDPQRGPFFSAFLHAQGRVLYDVFLYTQPSGGYLIEYDSRQSEAAPPLLPTLKRYVLRSKVKLRDVSDEYNVWAVWGSEEAEPERRWNWARSGSVEPAWDSAEWPWGVEDGVIKDRRAVGMGKRRLVRKGDKPQESSTHDILPPSAYVLHRVLHGVPEGIIDMPPMQAFPMDSNLDIMGALDFRKGCYVGQELTVRTYHTGMVRKRVLPVVLHKPSETIRDMNTLPNNKFPSNLDIRANIVRAPNDDRPAPRPRGTGKLLTMTEEGVALAILRLEHAEGQQRGEVRLEVDAGGENDGTGSWAVSSWWPDRWPKRSREDNI